MKMVSNGSVIVLFMVLAVLRINSAKEVPDYIHVCSRNDPDLNNCVTKVVESLRPIFTKGDPDNNIASVEPFYLGDLILSNSSKNGQGINYRTTENKGYGGSNYTISNMKIDMAKQEYSFDILQPKLRLSGNYTIDGRILLLPITGAGEYESNLTNCLTKVKLRGSLVERDGKTYLKFDSIELKIKFQKGNLVLQNLFGGDKTLGDVVNNVLNDNFAALSRDFTPPIEKNMAAAMLILSNVIVEQYTYDQLYPDT